MTRECVSLPNGLRIWLEEQPELHTVSFGFWIAAGSRMETAQNNGVSHFLEHMFFKGSKTCDAAELAARMDAIGGQMNAYTTKEYTCFYARTLTEHMEEGFELLADMLTDPAMDAEMVETERGVILEEIGMANDDPEDAVGEQLERAIWQASPYGMPILGTRTSVNRLTLRELDAYRREMYVPNRIVISVAGRFDRALVLRLAEKYFGGAQPGATLKKPQPIVYHTVHMGENRPLEQSHLCFCLPGLPARSNRRWAMSMLNAVVGSSTSSRLFQRIREELGLAYSIGSDISAYEGGGALYIQAAVNPEQAERCTREIRNVLTTARQGITEREFIRAREGLKSSLRMSMESSMSRASYAGRGALVDEVLPDDVLLAQVADVTPEEINGLAAELFDLSKLSVSVIGPDGAQLHEAIRKMAHQN